MLLLAAALASAACGNRWDEEQRATVLARYDARSAAAADGTGTAVGPQRSPGAGGTSTGNPGGSAVATPPAGGGGDGVPAVDAGGDPAAQAAGPLPCAAPTDAPGVTGDTITVGSISTLSGPVPGLGTSAEAAVRAYVAYRNASGGVCGRQIDLRTADDGADNARYRSLVNELEPAVLGLAGGFAAGDGGGAEVLVAKGIPVVSLAVSQPFAAAPNVFNINPPPADPNAAIGKYRWLHEQGVRKAAIVYIAVEQSRFYVESREKPWMQAAGIEIVNEQPLPLSTLSYDSAARAVANSGADYLFFLAEAGASASMAQAMHDTGYDGLRFGEYLSAYGSNFVELAGAGGEGATSWIRTLPVEDGGANPEQATYLQWLAQTAPNATPDVFAADSWAATKAFFDALEALPGPITRDAVVAQLQATTSYDAGGFLAPINLAAEQSNGCFAAMILEGGAWRRLVPDQGFLC